MKNKELEIKVDLDEYQVKMIRKHLAKSMECKMSEIDEETIATAINEFVSDVLPEYFNFSY